MMQLRVSEAGVAAQDGAGTGAPAAADATPAVTSTPAVTPTPDAITYSPDYVAVLPGYVMPSKAFGVTGTGVTISGIYGRQFMPTLSAEVNVQSSTFETGINRGTDFYQNGGTIDLVYSFLDRREAASVTPFLLLGIGGVYDDFFPNSRDGAAFLAEGGGGLVSKPLGRYGIQLRIDARYVHDGKEGGHEERRVLAGIELPLGRTQRHVEILPAKVVTREVVVVKEVPRPWIDSDGDGVEDDRDQCPNTPRGLKVDARGCVIENQRLALQGVVFDTSTSRLTLNATTVLDLISAAFVGQPTLRVEIAGHTDSVGSVASNLVLSLARAESVRTYLIFKGVRPEQLTAKGYGKSQLLVKPEAGPQDRERNRRVELRVLAQ
jgi:OOP family OmpA-OmpF porin